MVHSEDKNAQAQVEFEESGRLVDYGTNKDIMEYFDRR